MKLHPRSALFWRLYVVGIVQLGLVIVAAVVVGIFVVRMPPPWDTQGLTARLQPLIGRPSALAKALAEFRARRVSVSLYSPERHLIATNVVPALPLPAWGGTLPLRAAAHAGSQRWSEIARASGSAAHLPHRPMFAGLGWLGGRRPLAGSAAFSRAAARPGPPYTYVHFDIGGKAGLLVARFERPLPSAVPPLLTLAAGLLVIFVGAALTARWIARPLGQLSRAARALGRGDFGARTDLKRADELGEVGDAFNEMAGRIQELMLAEKELLANVAHELRTPLARIRVALEIAGESEVDVVNSSLSEIAVDLSELETLIDDVLTATRFELGNGNLPKAQFALHAEEISPNALGERAVERFRTRHPARALSIECSAELPVVEADPVLFRRVLDNLLENADKYSPDPANAIQLRISRAAERVTFEVADRGQGICAEDLPQVFTPFFRGEPSRSRDTGGVGLGLTLAKRIVEAHAGTIQLSSRPGGGTLAQVSLPARS
jgi:signal transduction histidine kinase